MKKRKIRLGDIYQITLPNGKFAFGRIFKDACIAIYKEIKDSANKFPSSEDYQFIVGVYEDVLSSGQWKIVDHRPFNNDEEAWPPPMYVVDKISGKFNIYHKGKLLDSTKNECNNLEEASVWEAEHIIDRIMGKDIWHKN